MKYYKFKETNHVIDWRKNTGYFLVKDVVGHIIPRFNGLFIKSKEELIQKLSDSLKQHYENYESLVNNIIKEVGIEEYECEFKNTPCIIIKCIELNDQYECDAHRVPTLYLKSVEELADLKLGYFYEVYLISKDGKLELCKEYSNYKPDEYY